MVHAAADPAALAEQIRAQVRAVDPDLPVGVMQTMERVAAERVAARRWSALLLALFAALGLTLAAAGVYGVTAHLVSLQTAEIGIRIAFDALPRRVLGQVLGEALVPATAGLSLGLAAAYAVMSLIRGMLFEVTARDPITFVGASATVLAMAAGAGLAPAVRAMKVDPVTALREG